MTFMDQAYTTIERRSWLHFALWLLKRGRADRATKFPLIERANLSNHMLRDIGLESLIDEFPEKITMHRML